MTLSGSVAYQPGVDGDALVKHLACCLQGARATRIEVRAHTVAFRGGMFRLTTRRDPLTPFGSGKLVVDASAHTVTFQLSLKELALMTTTIVGTMAGIILIAAPTLQLLLVPLVGWVWLMGANILIGRFRFQRFLQDAVARAPGAASA